MARLKLGWFSMALYIVGWLVLVGLTVWSFKAWDGDIFSNRWGVVWGLLNYLLAWFVCVGAMGFFVLLTLGGF